MGVALSVCGVNFENMDVCAALGRVETVIRRIYARQNAALPEKINQSSEKMMWE